MSTQTPVRPQRFRILFGQMERWPVERLPAEGETVFVDRGQTWGHIGKSIPAVLIDGAWLRHNRRPLPWAPTHWSRLIRELGQ